MSSPPPNDLDRSHRLRSARVLRVQEQACEIWDDGDITSVGFASVFPSPRTERVSPGHLVAVARGPNGVELVVWRWYDAVVLGVDTDDSVRLWEPAHGEVIARRRASYTPQSPGSRAYASAGLPGAEWWVADRASGLTAEVELGEVDALYTENGLWTTLFDVKN